MSSNIVCLAGGGIAIVSARRVGDDTLELRIRFVRSKVNLEELATILVRIVSCYVSGIDIVEQALGVKIISD